MDIKLGKVLTYSERLPSLKPYEPWLRAHMWPPDNLKNFYFHYQKTYD